MRRDDAYLLDILLAARQVLSFTTELTWQDFETSDLHQAAVIRNLEIVGEAARRVSPAFREMHPEIPWEEMAGMRKEITAW